MFTPSFYKLETLYKKVTYTPVIYDDIGAFIVKKSKQKQSKRPLFRSKKEVKFFYIYNHMIKAGCTARVGQLQQNFITRP